MTNLEKFEYITAHWYLHKGIVYSEHTRRPVAFANAKPLGHRYQAIKVGGRSGKYAIIYLHQAVYMLHYNKPIGEGMQIHHIDGNPLNNKPKNLIELTPAQHRRIHTYQNKDPMRGISLYKGVWRFQWYDDNGNPQDKRFQKLKDAKRFRAEIEEPRREELRALGLKC